jgi:hypothetical protein
MELIIDMSRRKLLTKTSSRLNMTADQFLNVAFEKYNSKNLDDMLRKFCLSRMYHEKSRKCFFFIIFFLSKSERLKQTLTKTKKWVSSHQR